jgi:2-dehydropantoate 2-reductase
MAGCMLEAKAAFEAQGFALDEKLLGPLKLLSLPDWLFDCAFPLMAHLLPADEFESSMNQDIFDAGRSTEVAYLNGAVVAAGEAAGVPTPLTARVLAVVLDMEAGRRPRARLTTDDAAAFFD